MDGSHYSDLYIRKVVSLIFLFKQISWKPFFSFFALRYFWKPFFILYPLPNPSLTALYLF